MGVKYGEKNAEIIRESNIKDRVLHDKQVKSVAAIRISNSNIESTITSSGRVVSQNNINISSEVSGKLKGSFSIKKGVRFRKGDILFKIKNTDIKLITDAKKIQFMNLISLNLADIKLDFPKEYTKWNEFFNSIKLNSQIGIIPETKTSKEKNFIISKGILTEYLSIKSDEEKLKKYTVKATFNGVITKSYTDIGANVNIGSPVIDVIRDGNMEVELTVNTNEIQFIDINNTVLFRDGKKSFTGKIIRKSSFVNENTQNISVFAEINSQTKLLYNGMYLNARITSSSMMNVSKIPRRAVFKDNQIFIVNSENRLDTKTINIIYSQGDNLVTDNIKNNTIVVCEPILGLKEGMIVKPIVK
tara:strand:- start:1662 stop:2738 length:1077 start_codon:yes stop_codon:yes gene_type:complete